MPHRGFLVIALLSQVSGVVLASDATALLKLNEAKKLFLERTDPEKVERALLLLDQAMTETENTQIQYDVLIEHSRTLYWKARHISQTDPKKAVHLLGKEKGDQAKALFPDWADAYYWSATHLSRWMEVSSITDSLSKKSELDKTLNAILDRDTKDGEAGETYEYWGVHRIAGRVYFKAPPFAGGSLEKALIHLEKSYSNAKNYALNVNYYAEAVYTKGKPSDVEKAKKILDELLAQDPQTYNPARVPETIEEFADAKKLRSEMNRDRWLSILR